MLEKLNFIEAEMRAQANHSEARVSLTIRLMPDGNFYGYIAVMDIREVRRTFETGAPTLEKLLYDMGVYVDDPDPEN